MPEIATSPTTSTADPGSAVPTPNLPVFVITAFTVGLLAVVSLLMKRIAPVSPICPRSKLNLFSALVDETFDVRIVPPTVTSLLPETNSLANAMPAPLPLLTLGVAF